MESSISQEEANIQPVPLSTEPTVSTAVATAEVKLDAQDSGMIVETEAQTSTEPSAVASAGGALSSEKKRENTIERALRGRVKSPILLAFNLFAAELRDELRKTGLMTGAEVEKVIGEKWKSMPKEEKDPLVENARLEQAKIIAQYPAGIPDDPESHRPNKKRKKSSGRMAASGSETIAQGAPPQAQLVGQSFDGVVDGMFDIGYFLTVKIGDKLLRGLVFRGSDTCAPNPDEMAAKTTLPAADADGCAASGSEASALALADGGDDTEATACIVVAAVEVKQEPVIIPSDTAMIDATTPIAVPASAGPIHAAISENMS
ncbi:hypothetical protein CYMTET_6966 [Cymbomonas tetramitiformis]|uniref:HMG box domain-containing protein n=1 Tax=Cymbomonas tetramitiformis TaxID=36881 RepID=A0AAE0GVZ9_9CHLO|nr:hypothetical protein CYMTET_6966 [Cymbomonas tetramitiformis]